MDELIKNNTTTTTTQNGDVITITQSLGIDERLIYIFIFLIVIVLLFMILGSVKNFIVGTVKFINRIFTNKTKVEKSDSLLQELAEKEKKIRLEQEKINEKDVDMNEK